MITPEQFKAAMAEIAGPDSEPSDEEAAHVVADNLLCLILDEHGYGDGVAIFKSMKKWYS